MEYTAFISYSHGADAAAAAAIQSGLHGFAKPWYMRRAMRIFRDKTSLAASPALWPSLEKALGASEFLILLASPKSAQSVWIEREVAWWMTNRSGDKLLVVLTAGSIVWDEARRDFDWERTTALPAVLQSKLSDEPLYVDIRAQASAESLSLRNSKFREAILDLASTLRGASKDDLDGEDVRQFRRTRRIAWSAGTVLFVLAIAFASAWWYAVQQRDLAVARDLAARSSLALTEGKVELGALLAVEAIRRKTSLESDNAIRRALGLLAAPVAAVKINEPVTGIAADREGRRIAIGGEQRLIVWDSAAGDTVPLASKTPVRTVAISDDGRRVLVIDTDDKVDLWDGSAKRQPPDAMEPIHRAGLSRNGSWAILVGKSGFTYVWDIDGGTARRLTGPAGERFGEQGTSAAVSDDGGRAIVAAPRMLRIWNDGAITRQRVPPDEWNATDLALAAGANRVVTYDLRTNMIDVWEPVSGMRIARMFAGAQRQQTLMTSASGQRIASNEVGGSAISIRDVDSRAPISAVHEWNVLYNNRAISGDGDRLVLFHDNTVRVWDVNNDQVVNLGHEGTVAARPIGVSGDGTRLLVTGDAGMRVIETATGREIWNGNASGTRQQAELSGDGRYVLITTADGTSQVVAVDAGGGTAVKFEETADHIAIGADGRRAVAVSQDAAGVINQATARIWNAESGALAQLVRLPQRVHRAAVSADGERLVLGFRETFWTWGASRWWWQQFQQFDVGGDAETVMLSPDGSRLAAARNGGVLQLWDFDSRQPLVYLSGLDPVETMAFSADGRSLITVSRGGRGTVLRRHLLHPDDLVAEVCSRVARNLTGDEWHEYIGAGSRRQSCPQFR